MNGPYLLAPTVNRITVAWETDTSMKATILYGVSGQLNCKLEVPCERGTPWKDNIDGICMYRAVLKNLRPDTLYCYRVELESGESQEGTFRTLKTDPNEIRLYAISDSHGFETNHELISSVIRDRPDFIIHSGDIPIGTGYQKDQFESLWFRRGGDLLRNIPIIYINGNHDAGPYFSDYFMIAQRNTYNTSPNGHNYSFDYGNTHFVVLDSNPWGLSEMNAVNSNLPVDEETNIIIRDSLKWLEDDLQSETAKRAKWRIVVMHHPYTDNFTYKHAVDILEKHGVNLVIAGHLHFYEKNISINPAVGAKTLYITQGSAQDPAGEMDYGKEDERILSEYPEVVALGKNIYSTIAINNERLVYKAYGLVPGDNEPVVVDEAVLVQEEPQIVLLDVTVENCNEDKNSLTFKGTVKNEGKGLAEAVLKVNDNGIERNINLFGKPGKERVVALNPGEIKQISGVYKVLTPGEHTIKLGPVTHVINVPQPSNVLELNNMSTYVGEGQFSNVVFVTLEVTNPHHDEYVGSLDLLINNCIVSTQKVFLESNERKVVNFSHRFDRGGSYKISVGNLEAKTVQIEGTLKGTPLIEDLSGNGNNGILRGNPKISTMEDGTISVALDNYSDYIEIPDNPSLHVKDGFSGIVWAHIDRLSQPDEKDHNPLMVKGPSVGWGVNYLLRMVIKKIGVTAWGTCHGTTEYAWDGGKVPIGEWAQYSSTFDRTNGGTGYINQQKVAEVAGPGKNVELRCWEGYPIFVGYSGIGHVIKELGRTKYFTHLPGKISQVRFYSAKLSTTDIKYLNTHPVEAGPKANNMLVWLDFKNIATHGTHKTEWRRPAQFHPAFKAEKQLWEFKSLTVEAKLPGSSSMTATVEVSDNEEHVKAAKIFQLTSGQQMLNLSGLPKAQFIRIVTRVNSSVGSDGTYAPELSFYQITAELENVKTKLIWGTRADWEKGSFEGAVGFEPLNRTQVIEEYTDVIH